MYVDDDLAAFHSELWLSYWKSCNNFVTCWKHTQAGWYTNTNTLCINCLHILFIIPYDDFKMIFFCLGLVRSYTTCHFDSFYNKKLFQHKHWQLLLCSAIMYDNCTHKKHKHTFFSLICYVSVCGYYYIIIFHNKEVTVPIHCWTINNIHFLHITILWTVH